MKKHERLSTELVKGAVMLMTLSSPLANAADFPLCAGEMVKAMPDGKQVKMWAYGTDNGTTCDLTVPGPRLTVPVGDSVLNITLRNTLPEATSVMIPGLASSEAPVFFNDAQGRRRVKSMVHETAAGASSSYSFTVTPGSYLYQSGTHPSKQVHMGLYGAVTNDAADGQAYAGIDYDNEIIMLYSEIDPAMHDAIAGATADNPATPADDTVPTYGTANGPTSMIDYKPRYFLVNGEPYTTGSTDLSAGAAGDRNLVRFMNAGLNNHSPMLLGQRLSLVAEYGNSYPYARSQYSMLLAAGQTRDAMFTASASGRLALYDRQLNLTNNAEAGDGGMMSKLSVADATPVNAPVANADAANTAEDTLVNINLTGNDTDNSGTGLNTDSTTITRQAYNGTAAVAGGGSVVYMPNADYNGEDTFTYTVRDNNGTLSNTATVTVTVTPVNDAPVAVADAYATTTDTALNVPAPGVLQNDTDVDGDVLTASIVTGPANGAVILNSGDGSFTYTPAAGFNGDDSFSYVANDGTVDSAPVQVTVSVAPAVNQPPVANDDYATVTRNTGASNNVATVIVLANDSDPDGTLDATTVAVTVNPNNGTATANADGSITYQPRAGFTGSDAFAYTVMDNNGQVSNTATVRIDVLRP